MSSNVRFAFYNYASNFSAVSDALVAKPGVEAVRDKVSATVAGQGDLRMKLCSEIMAKLNATFGVIERVREVLAMSSLLDPHFKQYSAVEK